MYTRINSLTLTRRKRTQPCVKFGFLNRFGRSNSVDTRSWTRSLSVSSPLMISRAVWRCAVRGPAVTGKMSEFGSVVGVEIHHTQTRAPRLSRTGSVYSARQQSAHAHRAAAVISTASSATLRRWCFAPHRTIITLFNPFQRPHCRTRTASVTELQDLTAADTRCNSAISGPKVSTPPSSSIQLAAR